MSEWRQALSAGRSTLSSPNALEGRQISPEPVSQRRAPTRPSATPVVLPNGAVRFGDVNGTEIEATLSPDELKATRRASQTSALPTIDPQNYQLTAEVAQGGIGRIFRARSVCLDRPVALKELIASAGPAAEERFIREALLTARLQHPAIVPLYEAGRWPTGEPFYTMKYVSGRSFAEVILESHTLEQRLGLLPHVLAVAEAMAYAHSERIIHRDLKPANVLVGPFGETVVIDWGLAKDLTEDERERRSTTEDARTALAKLDFAALEAALDAEAAPSTQRGAGRLFADALTLHGAIMGTPTYMPPEQAEGRPVDERADVYALGAILYHLLAGACPYEGESALVVLRQVAAGPPMPLKRRQKGIPEDLLAIVRKAMARAPAERYPSAKELADDLRRFQTGQIVAAHTYSPSERLRRYLRRNRGAVSVGVAAFVLLVAVSVIGVRHTIAQRERAEAGESAALTAQQLVVERADDLTLVQARAAAERDPNEALAWLKSLSRGFTRWPEARLIAGDAKSRGVSQVLRGHEGTVNAALFSPSGGILATTSDDHTVRLWDAAGVEIAALSGHTDEVWQGAFLGPNRLVTGSKDRTLRVWRTDSGQSQILAGPQGEVTEIAASRELIASGNEDGNVYLWDGRTGQSRGVLANQTSSCAVTLSPDGALLAMGGMDGRVRLWDVKTQKERALPDVGDAPIRRLAFSPDGKRLASKSADGAVRLWDMGRGRSQVILDGFLSPPTKMAGALRFSPDGAWLACTGEDNIVRLWDTATWKLHALTGHESHVLPLSFSPDSRLLATASDDHTARIWDLQSGEVRILSGFEDTVTDVAFSADGKVLAATSADRTARLLPVALDANRALAVPETELTSVAIASDGAHLLASGADGVVRVWDLSTFALTRLEGHAGAVQRAIFSPDGQLVFSAGADGTTRVHDLSGYEVWSFNDRERGSPASALAASPDGRLIARGGASGEVHLHEVDTGAMRALRGHEGQITSLAFSPDGKLLASTGRDRTLRLWDLAAATSQVVESEAPVSVATFSTDGRSILYGGEDHRLHIHRLAGGQAQAINTGGRDLQHIAILADDAIAITADSVATGIHVWDTVTGTEVRSLRGHSSALTSLALSPDGHRLVSASVDKTVRLWDLQSGESRVLRGHTGRVEGVAFSPDGKHVASIGADRTVRLWTDDLPEDGMALRAWLNAATPDTIGMYRHRAKPNRALGR